MAERARDMRQSPVHVLNHSQHDFRQRTTQPDLDEIEDWTDRAARRMYEGARLGPEDVDIFNPYDAYVPMAQPLPNPPLPGLGPGITGERRWGRGLPVARRQTRRCLRVLRGRYQGRGAAIWGTGAPVRPCTPTA
jgi:hypothetical protein